MGEQEVKKALLRGREACRPEGPCMPGHYGLYILSPSQWEAIQLIASPALELHDQLCVLE